MEKIQIITNTTNKQIVEFRSMYYTTTLQEHINKIGFT